MIFPYFKKFDALEDVENNIPSSDSILINYNYDSSNTLIATFNSTSDVNTFCNTYNHSNNYNGLKLGQRIQINDGTYNKAWYIAGFDCEYNNVASDCTIKNNGYGICLIPTASLISAQWNSSSNISGGYINSTIHTSTLPTVANNLKNVLGDHLINRNVLLSSSADTRRATAHAWTTSYCTLISRTQLEGFYRAMSEQKYDIGEAWYQIPLFKFIITTFLINSWMRDITSNTSANYVWNYANIMNETPTTSYGIFPLIYIR